jgi:hypothetical protein
LFGSRHYGAERAEIVCDGFQTARRDRMRSSLGAIAVSGLLILFGAALAAPAGAKEIYLHCVTTASEPALMGYAMDFPIDTESGAIRGYPNGGRAQISPDDIRFVLRGGNYEVSYTINRMTGRFEAYNSGSRKSFAGTCEKSAQKF